MKEDYDLVVVGAGPAGSTAAEAAAARGIEVALIERKGEIGTPVQCGGFLPEVHELQALLPHARLPSTLADIPERCILHRTRLQRIYSPSGIGKEFPVAGRVIDRSAFDRHLAGRAARAGAKIMPATKARMEAGELRLSGRHTGSMKPAVIIGADGPLSVVSKSMGNPRGERGLCLEYEMVDLHIDAEAAEMYFSARYAPGGYAWIIPISKNSANVGVGVRSSYLGSAKLPDLLDRFVNEHPIAGDMLRDGEILAVMQGLVPAGGSPGAIQKENLLLAGDAAGHVMATSGGGIPLAIVAGKIAGEVAADYIKGDAALQSYQSRIREEMGRELARSVQIRRMVDVAMHSDRLMDTLFGALSPDQMKSVMRAQIPPAWEILRELTGDGRIKKA